METWRNGDMETLIYGHGDIAWRHGYADIELKY
jgi:hypothetical protein